MDARRSFPAAHVFEQYCLIENLSNSKSSRQNQKAKQLCRQVERLAHARPFGMWRPDASGSFGPVGDTRPRMWEDFWSCCARPLRKRPRCRGPWEHLSRLEAAKGKLRREVATAITRKRAPELIFRVLLPGEVMP